MSLVLKCLKCGHRDSQLEADVNKAIKLYNGTLEQVHKLKMDQESVSIWKSEVETLRLEVIFYKQETERLKKILSISKNEIQDLVDKKVIAIKRREQKEADKWRNLFGKLQLRVLERESKND